jgi:hypothetical protein
MRPTVEEQLLGTCRILEQVVAPCVADPYARTMLEGLVANLRMLTAALPAVPGFLQDDNRATAALLGQLEPAVAPDLAASIGDARQRPEPPATDLAALESRNGELRALLSQALGGAELTPALREAVLAHMSSRAARSPMRYVSTAPSPAKAP